MTTIKKGTILKGKIGCNYVKVLAIIEDLVFLSRYRNSKDGAFKVDWGDDYCTLNHITENYDIVEEEWKPEDLKDGDTYWCLDSVGDTMQGTRRADVIGDDVFQYRLKAKNVFPTEKKAQEYRDKIMNS